MLVFFMGKAYPVAPKMCESYLSTDVIDEDGHAVRLNVHRDHRPTDGGDRTINHRKMLYLAFGIEPGANLVRSRMSVCSYIEAMEHCTDDQPELPWLIVIQRL